MSAVLNGAAEPALLPLEFVPMQHDDVEAILAVEQRTYAFPWSRGNFTDSLAAGYSAWVTWQAGALVGYAVLMLVIDEAHLLNITVLPEEQRHGLGSRLLEHLFEVARNHGAGRILLEVRPSNRSGRALYQRYGFAEIGRRRGYYPAQVGREDALVMMRKL